MIILTWIVLAVVVLYLGGRLLAIWAEREERRQADQAARMQRYMLAQRSHETSVWPRPKGPHGFQQRRKE